MAIASTGDGLSLGVSLVLLEIPDDNWIRQAIVTAIDQLTIEKNWREVGSNTPEISAAVFSLILSAVDFDYEPPPVTPVGSIQMFGSMTPPTQWLLCDGTSYLRADYVELFAAIGVTFGATDGTHFNVPDFTARSPMHPGNWPSGLASLAIGGELGEERHTLITVEIPAHSHGITQTPHSHPPVSPATVYVGRHATGSTDWIRATAGATFDQMTSTGTANANITINNEGSGNSHQNVHPVIGVPFIIFAGV